MGMLELQGCISALAAVRMASCSHHVAGVNVVCLRLATTRCRRQFVSTVAYVYMVGCASKHIGRWHTTLCR
jgi:hypothetical protein